MALPPAGSATAYYLGHGKQAHEFLTPAQLAELLGVHRETLYVWVKAGRGPPFIRLAANRILYSRADVDAWLASRRFPHRAAEAVAQRGAAA